MVKKKRKTKKKSQKKSQQKSQKKSKLIIIGVSILLLVILLVLGLTYAYYQTNIHGNTNEKDVDLLTENIEIEYADKTENIFSGEVSPGDKFYKTFTVTNTGVKEVKYNIILDKIENGFNRTSDWNYKLYEGEKVIEEGVIGKELPRQIILAEINITPKEIKEYKIEIEYKNAEANQADDLGKNIKFTVNIMNYEENIFKNQDSTTLLYAIGRDNKVQKIISSTEEAELSYTADDYGTSYYFRGSVDNNYVTFNNMCWRILRVLGNGNIKLVLASEIGPCAEENITDTSPFINGGEAFQYSTLSGSSIESAIYEKSLLKEKLETWYNEKFTGKTVNDYVVEAEWCDDYRLMSGNTNLENIGDSSDTLRCGLNEPTTEHHYSFNPTNQGSGAVNLINSKIGALKKSEIVFAGNSKTSWLNLSTKVSWTMSPWSYWAGEFPHSVDMFVLRSGNADGYTCCLNYVSTSYSGLGVIVLDKNVTITNSDSKGTLDNPYIID